MAAFFFPILPAGVALIQQPFVDYTMPRTITLVVPDGIETGDSLCFNAGGQDIELPLPAGAKPGDALQIQVADPEEAKGGDCDDGGGEGDDEGGEIGDETKGGSTDCLNEQNVRIDDDGKYQQQW